MALIPTLIEIDNIDEKAIEDAKIETQAKHVIPYKDWGTKAKSLDVFEIPIEFCKYRLENGRIREGKSNITGWKMERAVDAKANFGRRSYYKTRMVAYVVS